MRNIFRFLATALATATAVCALGITASAATTKFTDVDDKDENLSEAVAFLEHLGVTNGTSATTFGTNEKVTRQQMAAFIYRLVKKGKTIENASNVTDFTDLTDGTYFGYVSWAAQTKIIKGISDTEFNPEGGITLQDAYTMLIRALDYDEDELNLVYPYSYIDIAESDDVELDNNIPASVTYDTALTRGNVAILLYNAFFAETGRTKEESKIRQIGEEDGEKVYAVETRTVHPTFAEEFYDVEVGEFVVRATPKYCFNDSKTSEDYKPLYDMFDSDNLHLVAKESDEPVSEFYTEFEGLGLTGKADDQIMTTVKVYYTYKTTDGSNEVDEIFFASNMLQTIETNTANVTYKTVRNADDYLMGTSNAEPEGYLTVSDRKIYFFDAPYTYIKPNYSAASTEDERYWLRNEKDVKLINIMRLDTDEDTYSYYITGEDTHTAEDMYLSLIRVFSRGAYKMKFYDVDGDDVYEYLHYMPGTFGKMDADEDMTFSEDMEGNVPVLVDAKGDVSDMDLKKIPTIYYNDASLRGESFFDGDFVIAYLNPEANLIDVQTVVTPFKGYVSYIRRNSGIVKMNGKNFSTAYTYRTVENLYTGNSSTPKPNRFDYHTTSCVSDFANLTTADAIGEEFELYAYSAFGQNNILFYKHTGGKRLGFSADKLIIPLRDEDALSGGKYWTESHFDSSIDGRAHFTKVWLNGEERFVSLNIDEMYPRLEYADGSYSMSTPSKEDDTVSAYLEKIATYEVGSDGRYIIKPFMHAYDEDGDYIGVNRDAETLLESDNTEQYGNDLGYNYAGKIKKVTSTRFKLLDESGESLLGDVENGPTINYFVLTKSSVIIIKNIDTRDTADTSDDEVEYLVYDIDSFGGETDDDVLLTNIQYVLKGDPDSSSRADLLVLYAEAEDFEFAEKKNKDGYRIVSSFTPGVDSEGDYRNYYTLLNPFTGSVEEDVPGNKSRAKADSLADVYETGDIVELKSGKVDESNDDLGRFDTSVTDGLVWITEYDATDDYIAVVPVEATEEACCLEKFNSIVEGYTYDDEHLNYDGEEFILADGATTLYYEINDETTITVLKSEKTGAKAITDGTYSLGDISTIADAKKDFKCYNNKYPDSKGNYKTNYAPYIKAYVMAKEAKDSEDMPIAEHIVVIVNGNDSYSLLLKECEDGCEA